MAGIIAFDEPAPPAPFVLRVQSLPVDAYYDAVRREYLLKNSGGRWLSHSDANFQMHLRALGVSTKRAEGARLSRAEEIILEIQETRDVRYVGPLAGRSAGFYDEDGVRFLVTEAPRIVAPEEGEWPLIKELIFGLVGEDPSYGKQQIETLLGWLKFGYESIASGRQQPGQALALAGPPKCGKSLLQMLITACLGGRSAKPYRYLTGATQFNGDLFGAEHLMVEDEESTTDIRSRLKLGAHIKGITVNATHSCHAKMRDAVTLSPQWRLSISLELLPTL